MILILATNSLDITPETCEAKEDTPDFTHDQIYSQIALPRN